MGLAREERYLPQLVACALEFVAHGRCLGLCRAELPLRRLLRDAPSCGYRSLAHGWTGPQGADWLTLAVSCAASVSFASCSACSSACGE
jgi:hypothetical protein